MTTAPVPPPATVVNVTVVDAVFTSEAAAASFAHRAPELLNLPASDVSVQVSGVDARVSFHGPSAVANAHHFLHMPAAQRSALGIQSLSPAPTDDGGDGDGDNGIGWRKLALYIGAPVGAVILITAVGCVVYRRRRRSASDVLDSLHADWDRRSTASTSWELGSVTWADGTHTPTIPKRERRSDTSSPVYRF